MLHSSPIIDHRHSKKIKNWRTLILNCQSLRGKVEAFQSSVDYFQPDCILGTEFWLDKSVSTNEIFPPGYKIFRRDRITSTQGGGECLSLSKKIMTYLSSLILLQTQNFYDRQQAQGRNPQPTILLNIY